MMDIVIRPYGPAALLVRFAENIDDRALARCRGILQTLGDLELPGLVDVVPAYGEVLLEFDFPIERTHSHTTALIKQALHAAEPIPAEAARLHEIPVRYDGPDLADLAREKGLPVSEIVERHSRPTYDVYQIGFAPGFPYLGPLDPLLHAERLTRPRARIPPGSVGIGGEHTGIYSIASPGGWRLIGQTASLLFNPGKAKGSGTESAFLLRQGDRVKFVPLT